MAPLGLHPSHGERGGTLIPVLGVPEPLSIEDFFSAHFLFVSLTKSPSVNFWDDLPDFAKSP